jgi:hypothetical protein
VQNEQVSGPGLITVLVTLDKTPCNINTPGDANLIGSGSELVDWQIAVIVVACIVAAGAAILAGILIRKQQLAKEMRILGSGTK